MVESVDLASQPALLIFYFFCILAFCPGVPLEYIHTSISGTPCLRPVAAPPSPTIPGGPTSCLLNRGKNPPRLPPQIGAYLAVCAWTPLLYLAYILPSFKGHKPQSLSFHPLWAAVACSQSPGAPVQDQQPHHGLFLRVRAHPTLTLGPARRGRSSAVRPAEGVRPRAAAVR